MPHKIVFIIRDLGYGGAQRQLVTLARGLDRDQFDPCVVHFYPGPMADDLRAAGVEAICIDKRGRWDLPRFLIRLCATLKVVRPDIVHGYLTESNLMAGILGLWCQKARIVWGIRDSASDAHLWGALGRCSSRLARLLSRRANLIIANSRSGAEYYGARGYPRERIQVVPNGIDVNRFCDDPWSGARLREEWGLRNDEVLFGIVGRINAMKDHATFLHAASIVAEVAPRARFACVGDGPEESVREIRELADSLGIAEQMIWSEARRDVTGVFNALDAVVSSSAYGEGFSNVIGEAMACGTPCLVTDVGDSALLVGDAGRVAPPREPEKLAQAMIDFIDMDIHARIELKQKARARIQQHFTEDLLVRRTTELLRSLVGKGGRAATTLDGWEQSGLSSLRAVHKASRVIAS